jgi:hypothetical protein
MCADHDTLLGRIAIALHFFIVHYQNICFALNFHQFIKKELSDYPVDLKILKCTV